MIPRWLGALALVLFAAAGLSAQRISVLEPLDATGRVTYFVADGVARSKFQQADRDLATWAIRAWERSLNGALRFEPAAEDEALVRVYWVPASAGQYGEMRAIDVGGRRGAAVYIRPDTDALGDDIAQRVRRDPLLRDTIVYLTCVHELGHALGLEHTREFDDIMYSFGYGGDVPAFFDRYRRGVLRRQDLADLAVLSPGDVQRLLTRYGR